MVSFVLIGLFCFGTSSRALGLWRGGVFWFFTRCLILMIFGTVAGSVQLWKFIERCDVC